MRLLTLTPARDEPRFARIAQTWLDRLSAPLNAAGVEVVAQPWTETDEAAGFDGVTPLLAWSYHHRPDEWSALLDRLERSGTRTINLVETLRWNTRKTYLTELERAGAPVIPTLFVDRFDDEALAQAHQRFGPDLIAKPQVSGGSHQTVRLTPGASLAGAPEGPAMIQPFMPPITAEGELSMLYFGGRFSHAVAKVAAEDDFRVQFQYGGTSGPADPPLNAFEAAERVLAAAGQPLTYARIDLIRAPDGRFLLMELEAIEPDLFLQHAPDGGAAFANAMRRALEE